jgi:8-oxo-dGTP diphosphatase
MPDDRPPALLLVAAAALVDPDGRVLVQQRTNGALAGLWEFPGGKLEPGETPAVALVRELREELGIDVETACLAPAAFASEPLGARHLLLLHVCRKWKGVPRPIEAAGLRWLRPVELHALPMPDPDRPLIGLLEALV